MCSVAFSCFSVSFYLICRLCFYTLIEHLSSPKHTVFYCFIGLCFVKRVSALNCKRIINETDCFHSLLPRINPRTSSLTALCITHCSYLSICLLSSFANVYVLVFSNFRFVFRQIYSLFIIIVRALSVFSFAFSCFSVYYKLICCLWCYMFIEHVCSPIHTVFYCFIGLCIVKRVSAFNCKLINNETDWNSSSV